MPRLKSWGYRKDDRVFERTDEYTPLPDAIEQELREMNHISQFQALRKLHDLTRREGPTVSRLCGLVRGVLEFKPTDGFYPGLAVVKYLRLERCCTEDA